MKEMAYSPGDLSSLLLNTSSEPSRRSNLGGAKALFRTTEDGGSKEQVEGLGLVPKSTIAVKSSTKRKRQKLKEKSEEGGVTTNDEECEDSPELCTTLPAQISTKKKKKRKRKGETEGDEEELTDTGGATNAEENGEGSSNLKLLHPGRSTDSGKDMCTIFVGNLPLGIKPKRIKSYFKSYGQVESVRLRSLAIKGTKVANSGDQTLVRRVCAMKGQLDESVKDSTNAYVVFHGEHEAIAALAANGVVFEGRNLRIDRCMPTIDPKLSVFVGNLPYSTSEQTLWEHFADGVKNYGGDGVRSVRIIRDRESQVGKGFAYVTFIDQKSVNSALKLHDKPFNKRKLRILVCGKRFKCKQGGSSKKKASGHSNNQGDNFTNSFEGRRGASGGHVIGAQRRVAGKEKRKWKLVANEGGDMQRFAGKKLKKQKRNAR